MTSLGSVYERWLLESEADRSGNSVTFTYTTLDDGNLGVQYLPERISYTKHASGLNAQQLSVLIPHRSVDFAYKDRPDIEFRWEAGVRTSLKKRLVSITMSAPAPGNVAPVWVYRFAYTTSGFSGRSLLSSVQKCGLPGIRARGRNNSIITPRRLRRRGPSRPSTPRPSLIVRDLPSYTHFSSHWTLTAMAPTTSCCKGAPTTGTPMCYSTELKGSPKKYQVGDNQHVHERHVTWSSPASRSRRRRNKRGFHL